MRDLPLNEKKRKEGCLFLTALGIFLLVGIIIVYYMENCK
jgi:hypothetical protein